MSDEASRESAEQWGGAAEAWARAAEEEETGASASATRWMLETAALRPGEEVLELACGAGRVGLEAARMVQPGGTVLCSDFSEAMVQAVRDRVSRTGIENVGARVLDAEDLSLDSQRFDVVLCRFGYMLMSDPAAALGESRRVLRPGGRLLLAVWGEAGENPWLAAVMAAIVDQLGAPPPEPGTPGGGRSSTRSVDRSPPCWMPCPRHRPRRSRTHRSPRPNRTPGATEGSSSRPASSARERSDRAAPRSSLPAPAAGLWHAGRGRRPPRGCRR